MATAPSFASPPFRLSHSTTDLQGLQHNFFPLYPQPPFNSGPSSQVVSQSTSATMTPRNLSRQASPSGPSGPFTKKRKASRPNKVPTGLAMTKLETPESQSIPRFMLGAPANVTPPANVTSPANVSSYSQTRGPSITQTERPYATASIPAPFSTGPSTPNNIDLGYFTPAQRSQSMENLPLQQMFSAPSSAHPSRVPSPNSGGRINANSNDTVMHQSQAQMAQAVANSLYGVPLALNRHQPPTIHKLIPCEGPRAGGIEVTCLGSGFCQGLEVMFGCSRATTTTYWGDASLVCLLPPAAQAGFVPVTFRHQRVQQMHLQQYSATVVPKQQIQFRYLDDDEQQLLKLALNIVGHKMTGRMEDAGDVARRIVSSGPNTWAASPTQGSTQHRQASVLGVSTLAPVDLETSLLACLDLIDLDDSPFPPRFKLRRPTGHSLLHYAASLGLHRFLAGLLARGANPDVRDKGGYSPMHYASLHDHPHIVRRLSLAGGDPNLRSLRGYTPADLAASPEVLQATRSVDYHSRSRSAGTDSSRSRGSSVTSLRSRLRQPSFTSRSFFPTGNSTTSSDDQEGEHSNEDDSDGNAEQVQASPADYWSQSRRNSRTSVQPGLAPQIFEPNAGLLSPSAAMAAWRDQLSAQIQHFQHSVHWTLPNLPIPALPQMPNLPYYQAYPMVRRISSLVPHRGGSRSSASPDAVHVDSKEGEYGWWELLTGAPLSPPAYEEIYPGPSTSDIDTKTMSVLHAATKASLDQKCVQAFDENPTSGLSTQKLEDEVKTSSRSTPNEHHEQLRIAHAKKVKRIRSDRNLFFIWVSHLPFNLPVGMNADKDQIPLLVIVVVAMLKNRVPQVWNAAMDGISYIQNRSQDRSVEGH